MASGVRGVCLWWGQDAGEPREHVGEVLRVAAFWALPLLGGLLVWSVRSFSHPRYITMFAVLLVPQHQRTTCDGGLGLIECLPFP